MEKDPCIIERLAAERSEENWRFRTFLKRLPAHRLHQINALAERLGRDAEAQMDCRTCAACCRTHHVPIDEVETGRLAGLLALPVVDFRRRHMEPDDDGEPALKAPCAFLTGNECSIYPQRPDACRGFPYIGGDIAGRMVGIIERAGTCPIVFEMLEGLKRCTSFWRYRSLSSRQEP